MTAQVVTTEELVEYLTVTPAGELDAFQAYEYGRQENAPCTKAALIN